MNVTLERVPAGDRVADGDPVSHPSAKVYTVRDVLRVVTDHGLRPQEVDVRSWNLKVLVRDDGFIELAYGRSQVWTVGVSNIPNRRRPVNAKA